MEPASKSGKIFVCCANRLSGLVEFVNNGVFVGKLSADSFPVEIWCSSGADEWEHANPLYSCHGVFTDRFIFRSRFPGVRLPWECHDQLKETNWRHCVNWTGTAFLSQKKRYTKIDQSAKTTWQKLNMGVLIMLLPNRLLFLNKYLLEKRSFGQIC